MTFWLDDVGRRPVGRIYHATEPAEPGLPPETSEPVIVHAAPQKKVRRTHLSYVLLAVGGAMGFHGFLAILLLWSASKTKLKVEPAVDTAAMFASLTPASSISLHPSDQPPTPSSAVTTISNAAEPNSQTLAAAPNNSTPAETNDAPALQSAQVDEAALNVSPRASADITPLHEDTYNPWAHASVASPVLSVGEKLWQAILPCFQSSQQGPLSIRLILDEHGQVQNMTNTEGGEAQADPKLQTLARATLACAPYDHLVQSAGSYLVTTPG